jgi:hypothetical protein
MNKYAIQFDFPDTDYPLFAGLYQGSLGWAPTLTTAKLFDTAEDAARILINGYTAVRTYGQVIEVKT